jgi:hypothetical protein
MALRLVVSRRDDMRDNDSCRRCRIVDMDRRCRSGIARRKALLGILFELLLVLVTTLLKMRTTTVSAEIIVFTILFFDVR